MFTGIIRQTGKITKISKKEGLMELTIVAPTIASNRQIGDSVSVDGACLTVVALGHASASTTGSASKQPATSSAKTDDIAKDKTTFTVQAIPETLARTIIPTYKINQLVNLETPMRLGDELHGHMVQGHVDFVGTVTGVKADGNKTVISVKADGNKTVTVVKADDHSKVTHVKANDPRAKWKSASNVISISFPPEMAKYLALKGSITINGVSLTVSLLKEKSFEVSLIPETIKGTNLKLLKKDSKVNVEVDLIARYLDRLLQKNA